MHVDNSTLVFPQSTEPMKIEKHCFSSLEYEVLRASGSTRKGTDPESQQLQDEWECL